VLNFVLYFFRQNINELDIIHKNLEVRLEQLETKTSQVHHLTKQQSYHHQSTGHLTDDQHLLNIHQRTQSLHLDQGSHVLDQHLHSDQFNQIPHIDPLVSNDPILSGHSKLDDKSVHSSKIITSSHEEPMLSYTKTHEQHSREQSSTMDYSSDGESSSNSSDVFADNEMDPRSSTAQPHTNDITEGTANCVTHKSTSSNSSVISDSCASDSESEKSSVEADGQPCYGDRVVMSLNNVVSHSQDDQHVSIASNLTTVTPTELSSLSDDKSDENQSSSGEDDREQDEVEMVANSESSERSETSQTSIVTQSLLNKDDNIKEQQPVTNSLKDVTNSLLQPLPTTLHQEDERTSFTSPSSHSPVQKSPPKR